MSDNYEKILNGELGSGAAANLVEALELEKDELCKKLEQQKEDNRNMADQVNRMAKERDETLEREARVWAEAAKMADEFASDSQNLGQHWAANQLIDLSVRLKAKAARAKAGK